MKMWDKCNVCLNLIIRCSILIGWRKDVRGAQL